MEVSWGIDMFVLEFDRKVVVDGANVYVTTHVVAVGPKDLGYWGVDLTFIVVENGMNVCPVVTSIIQEVMAKVQRSNRILFDKDAGGILDVSWNV